MTELFKIIAIAVTGGILSVFLKEYRKEYALLLRLVTSVVLLFLISDMVSAVVGEFFRLTDKTGINQNYIEVIMKTLGIAYIVWYHRISARIGAELKRRNVAYKFGAADYWLWNVLGTIIVVGPLVYAHKLFKATNKMCEHYNING